MESEEVILRTLENFRKDFETFRFQVNENLTILHVEVGKLKTKAGFIGALSGGLVSIITGLIVGIVLFKINK